MIVLIGNAQESGHRLNGCSAIIDSGKPRLVVRVPKMCNYDSGKTGTRCGWAFLNPNPAYWTFPPERRHWGVLAGASKIIITCPPPGTMKDGPCISLRTGAGKSAVSCTSTPFWNICRNRYSGKECPGGLRHSPLPCGCFRGVSRTDR